MDQRDRDVLSAPGRREAKHLLPSLLRLVIGLLALSAVLTMAERARAGDKALLVPTAVEATPGRYAPASSSQDGEVRRHGAEIDRTIAEAVEDMGLEVVPSDRNATADGDLPDIGQGSWAFAARFELRPEGALLRIVAVSPGSRVLLVREEDFEGDELGALSVRAVVMVRDIVESGRGQRVEHARTTKPSRVHDAPPPPPSSGRAVLALNATLYGGYVGFSLQRAANKTNSRLVYPMVALGAGLGLGASLLIADEWNIDQGEAWYLAAGAYWPGASGFLIADSYGKPLGDRYLYSLLGATTGVGLGTVALATSTVGEGGAVLTHSGGAFGMLLGAMTQVAIDGSSESPPKRGMGFGTGIGVLGAGIAATQVDISASRMLLVDISVSLGGLGGAALASPLLYAEPDDPLRIRLWLGAVAAGAVAGGVIGWHVTDTDKDDGERSGLHVLPYATYTPSRYGNVFDVGVSGSF